MKIKTERLDERIPLVEEAAKKIAMFVLSSNDKVFSVFSDVLLGCHKYKTNTFLNEKIIKKIDMQKFLYPEIVSELEQMKNLMWEYFSFVDDFKLDSVLKINSAYYKNLEEEQEKLDKLRGVLFEILIENIIEPRYKKHNFETGCMVILEGEKIISYYQNKSRKTIDIAAYEEEKGEFYECKLSPKSLNAESYQYLNLLDNKLCGVSGYISIVGCVTLGEKLALKTKQIQIEKDLAIHNTNIRLYGSQELLFLRESPFENAV